MPTSMHCSTCVFYYNAAVIHIPSLVIQTIRERQAVRLKISHYKQSEIRKKCGSINASNVCGTLKIPHAN